MMRHQQRHTAARSIGDRLRLYVSSPDDGDRNCLRVFAILVRTVASACLIGCVHISGCRSLTPYRLAFSVPATEHAEEHFEVGVFRRLQHSAHNIVSTRNAKTVNNSTIIALL